MHAIHVVPVADGLTIAAVTTASSLPIGPPPPLPNLYALITGYLRALDTPPANDLLTEGDVA